MRSACAEFSKNGLIQETFSNGNENQILSIQIKNGILSFLAADGTTEAIGLTSDIIFNWRYKDDF